MSTRTVKEGNPLTFTLSFYDENGIAVTPSTARYRVKDITNDRVVLDWTDATPAESMEITVTPEQNTIYDTDTRNRQRFEERSLVVQADTGTDNQFSDECLYRVINLRGYES